MKVSIQEVISGRIDDTKDILQKSDENITLSMLSKIYKYRDKMN